MSAELSASELVFARRMLPHFLAGKTAEQAAAAVIEDDARLFTAIHERSSSHFLATADERGLSYRTREGQGDVIAAEMSADVYRRLHTSTAA